MGAPAPRLGWCAAAYMIDAAPVSMGVFESGAALMRTSKLGGRIRVRTITITAPQHRHTIGARTLIQADATAGTNFSSTCTNAISRLQFECKKPKLRARGPGESFDGAPGQAKAIHQSIDPVNGVMLGLIGQVGITNGGENRMMAEDLLYRDQVNAGFDQMRGVAVAQAVRGNLFFRPHDAMTWCNVVCTPPGSSGVVALVAPFSPR